MEKDFSMQYIAQRTKRGTRKLQSMRKHLLYEQEEQEVGVKKYFKRWK